MSLLCTAQPKLPSESGGAHESSPQTERESCWRLSHDSGGHHGRDLLGTGLPAWLHISSTDPLRRLLSLFVGAPMKLVGLMPVRNEDWCLGLSLRVALLWCDEVVVLLHACTDGSGAIVAQVTARERERVRIIVDDDPTWKEMEHRQQMLAHARIRGATHIAMIDADEILTGNLLPDRHGLDSNQGSSWDWYPRISHGNILQLPGYNLRGCVDRHAYVNRKARLCGIDERLYHYHQNGVWGNRWFSTAFQDDPRLGWSGDRFHAREPQGIPL